MKRVYSRTGSRSVMVDDEDYDELSKHTWYISARGYAQALIDGKMTLMHRLIMQPPDDMHIDHRDRDKTNNQRTNLRIVTKGVNAQNTAPKSNNTSGYVGVSKNGIYWQSSIYQEGKRQFIGNFKDKESAALAYNERALLLYGDNAYLNVIRSFALPLAADTDRVQ